MTIKSIIHGVLRPGWLRRPAPPRPARPPAWRWLGAPGVNVSVRDLTDQERRGWLADERIRHERRRWLHRRGQYLNPPTWRTR